MGDLAPFNKIEVVARYRVIRSLCCILSCFRIIDPHRRSDKCSLGISDTTAIDAYLLTRRRYAFAKQDFVGFIAVIVNKHHESAPALRESPQRCIAHPPSDRPRKTLTPATDVTRTRRWLCRVVWKRRQVRKIRFDNTSKRCKDVKEVTPVVG